MRKFSKSGYGILAIAMMLFNVNVSVGQSATAVAATPATFKEIAETPSAPVAKQSSTTVAQPGNEKSAQLAESIAELELGITKQNLSAEEIASRKTKIAMLQAEVDRAPSNTGNTKLNELQTLLNKEKAALVEGQAKKTMSREQSIELNKKIAQIEKRISAEQARSGNSTK